MAKPENLHLWSLIHNEKGVHLYIQNPRTNREECILTIDNNGELVRHVVLGEFPIRKTESGKLALEEERWKGITIR